MHPTELAAQVDRVHRQSMKTGLLVQAYMASMAPVIYETGLRAAAVVAKAVDAPFIYRNENEEESTDED